LKDVPVIFEEISTLSLKTVLLFKKVSEYIVNVVGGT
jgi:hypothetical protein